MMMMSWIWWCFENWYPSPCSGGYQGGGLTFRIVMFCYGIEHFAVICGGGLHTAGQCYNHYLAKLDCNQLATSFENQIQGALYLMLMTHHLMSRLHPPVKIIRKCGWKFRFVLAIISKGPRPLFQMKYYFYCNSKPVSVFKSLSVS